MYSPAPSTPLKYVLPFYVTGALAFLILTVMMYQSADAFTGHYFNPHLLSMVHTAALGWGTMVIFGALYQLLPVLSERKLYLYPLCTASWYSLTTGTLLLVYAFRNFTTGWVMIAGGAFIVLAVMLCWIQVFGTYGTAKKSIHTLFITSSITWLLITVIIGLLLTIHLYRPFFAVNHLEILKLHAHAGLAGWFVQLITGVSSKLVPMFLVGHSTKNHLLTYSFILQNAALTGFMVDGYLNEPGIRILLYAGIMMMGIACWLLYLYDAASKRLRKKVDTPVMHTLISVLCLLAALISIPFIYFIHGTAPAIFYGSLLFMGFISGIILGKTFKTLPFMIWNTNFKKQQNGNAGILPKHLYKSSWVNIQFALFIVSIVMLCTGIALSNLTVIQTSMTLWITVALVYLLNVLGMILYQPNKKSIHSN